MVYTTDVVADRVEFLEWGNTQASQETHAEAKAEPQEEPETAPTTEPETAPSGFEQIDEDIPF